MVKMTKNSSYFNRYGCGLGTKRPLSMSQIFVTVTKSFLCVNIFIGKLVLRNLRSGNKLMKILLLFCSKQTQPYLAQPYLPNDT